MISIRLIDKVVIVTLIGLIFSQSNPEDMFKKSFDLLNKHYIDSIDQVKVVESAIKGMLEDLDPYTKLLIDEGKENHDKLSKGKYGGIGIRIGSSRDTLLVLSTMKGGPAINSGLKSGDQIISVGKQNMIGKTTKEASSLIKGKLGTLVNLGIARPGIEEILSFDIKRDNIKLNNIGYKQIDENSIGYIKVNRFSRNISTDFINALKYIDQESFIDSNGNNKWDSAELYRDYNNNGKYDESEPYGDSNSNGKYDKGEPYEDVNSNGVWDRTERYVDKNGNGKWDDAEIFFDINSNNQHDDSGSLKGLVIDLRGNGGGLLSEAKNMVDILIDKNQLYLYTKGRGGKILEKTKTKRAPALSSDIPIAILVNEKSASASEILSGAIQDLDRGVIIGKTTLGKGLVQRVRPLNDSTSLKITSAKYYTPSGRLIQKEDWLNNGVLTDGQGVADSIFYTVKNKREVKGGGGIVPDIIIESNKKVSPYINALWRSNLFLSFSSKYLSDESNKRDFDLRVNKALGKYIDGYWELQHVFTPALIKSENVNIDAVSQIDIIDNKILKAFKTYLAHPDYTIEYTLSGEEELDSLKSKIENLDDSDRNFFVGLFSGMSPDKMVRKMEEYYSKKKNNQFENKNNREFLISGLEREFARFLFDEEVRVGVSLRNDDTYFKGIEILKDKEVYNSILGY